ncbi:hypothetical protein [Aromatoleum petrolei]|uniref:Uncharacterized protein n=1 Tax=Aromatoleum petrolei TaxID=76116 RepID=A0ABX1MMQ0_9RHOO|nr:hypothetical protein [Aromatoleum petrolei]NMF89228.1 hypothetical protein [Aromatoleum petrolei]QTQ34979.1 Uncharacterized protein ToN1_08050 [Aromatoleum petrolei]
MQQEIDMWVLVRHRDVSALSRAGRNRLTTDREWRAGCLEYLQTTLLCHPGTLARTEVVWRLACRAPDEADTFWSIIRVVRAKFNHALASTLDRMCVLLPEAGADQMEIPIGADGGIDWPEALFPMGAALLTHVAERLQDTHDSDTAGEAVLHVLTDLARLLSDHLTDQSPFFDAIARSVRVPSDKVLMSALAQGELLLLPVRRISDS